MNQYVNILIAIFCFFYGAKTFIKSIDDLMRILLVITLIQTVILYISLFVPSFQAMLNVVFNAFSAWEDKGEGIVGLSEAGYNIGLGCMTSTGSLQLSLGLIASSYFLLNPNFKKWPYILSFIAIAFASVTVARTSLLIVAACGCVILFYNLKGGRAIATIFVTIILFFIGFQFIKSNLDWFGDTFKRLIYLFENGIYESYFNGFLGEVGDNVIPPLCFETLVGTGVTYGTAGCGLYIQADGGFLRSYFSMGLIVAIINYIIILRLFIKPLKGKQRYIKYIIYLFLLIFLIGEFKEPFIYKNYYLTIYFLFTYLLELSNNRNARYEIK